MSPEQILTAIAIADRIGDADEVTRLRALLVASMAPAPVADISTEAPTAPLQA